MRGTSLPAVALAAALVLAGCSDGADADADGGGTPTSPAATEPSGDPSGTPVVQAPSLPVEAREQTEAGAEAFVRYYVELMNYGQASGDASPLEAVSAQECGACSGFISTVDDVYVDGGAVEGGEFVIRELSPLPLDYGADYATYAVIDVAPQTILDAGGQATASDAYEYRIGLYPSWVDDAWEMTWIVTPSAA